MTQSSSSSSSSKIAERFIFLPISIIGAGCNSHSSIQVAGADQNASDHHEGHQRMKNQRRRIPTKSSSQSKPLPSRRDELEEDDELSRWRWSAAVLCSREKKRRKNNKITGPHRPSNSAGGVNKLVTTMKASISQLFVYKQSAEDEEEEDEEEMEIGFPTDVKHVTHIGLDGSTKGVDADADADAEKEDWTEKLKAPADQIISFPTISLKQFEIAMAAQAHGRNFNLASHNDSPLPSTTTSSSI
ncbi:CRIB domain-containing protein RIC1 [Linum perenne]